MPEYPKAGDIIGCQTRPGHRDMTEIIKADFVQFFVDTRRIEVSITKEGEIRVMCLYPNRLVVKGQAKNLIFIELEHDNDQI